MEHHARQEPVVPDNSRRKLLKLAALGGGVCLLAALPEARSAGATDVFLLTCMDFRLMDDIERYMTGRGLRDKYDHVILAGASLGAVTDKYPAWNRTFWEHLDIAITLHNVHTVMIMDHRDCGAYKLVFGEAHTKDLKTEKETHSAQLEMLKNMINRNYPELKVETLLMGLDGVVEAA